VPNVVANQSSAELVLSQAQFFDLGTNIIKYKENIRKCMKIHTNIRKYIQDKQDIYKIYKIYTKY